MFHRPFTKNFRYLKWRNPEPYKAIFGVCFPLYKPYPNTAYMTVRMNPPFLVPNEMFGDPCQLLGEYVWVTTRHHAIHILAVLRGSGYGR